MASGHEFTCCHCGVVTGQAHWNRKGGLSDDPCPKCTPIVNRQRDAKRIKWDRRHKKELSKFGKELLLLEEKSDETESVYGQYLPMWTRMRYVSQEEINDMSERRLDRIIGGYYLEGDSSFIVLRRRTAFERVEEYITRPGFYRAEKAEKRDLCFWTACASGIPTNRTDGIRKHIEYVLLEKRENGEKKWSEKLDRDDREDQARRDFGKSKISRESVGFFRTLAMAGVVTK